MPLAVDQISLPNQFLDQSKVCVIRKKLHALFSQGFVKSVGVLVGGTAFGQALMVLVLPLLTRLYTPADFSLVAVYTSVLGIVAVAACLRLEIAIPLPLRDEDAINLLALALCCSAGVAVLSGIIVGLLPDQIVGLIKQPNLQPYLWLLPLGIWFSSSYAALQFWMIRKKNFSVIAKTRMTQAVGSAGIQAGLGWIGIAPLGLLLGQMINSGAGIFGLAQNVLRNNSISLRSVNWQSMKRLLFEYKRFPKYSIFESLANSINTQLPIIIIAALAAGPEAGFFMLGSRLMHAPMALIGGAVAQVYLSQAPEELRKGTLGKFSAHIIGGLMKAGVGPLIFACIVAPVAVPLVFGDQWQRAGDLITWMGPWFIMEFLVSPISMALHVTHSQQAALILQILGLVMRVGLTAAAGYWAHSWIVEAYAVSSFCFYFVYFCVVASITKIKILDLFAAFKSYRKFFIFWILLAIFFRVVI